MMKKFLFILLLFSFYAAESSAQLAAWNFGANVKGNEQTSQATITDTSIEVSELSRGPGTVAQKATCSFAGTWPACSSMIGAVRQGAYYQFTLKSKKGYLLSLDRISLVLRVQPDGPRAYILTYTTDGENIFDIGSPVRIGPTGNNGEKQPDIDLSQIAALQNIPPRTVVTFRLYAWGGKDSDNNAFRIGKSTPSLNALAIYGTAEKNKQ